jgi:hypothetical protein
VGFTMTEAADVTTAQYFDRIVVISLADRHDRRAEMTRELERVGAPLNAPRVVFFDAIRPTDRGEFQSIGAHGCFMSHLETLRRAEADGVQRLLVMEDDLQVAPEWRAKERTVLSELAHIDWGVAYLGNVEDIESQVSGWLVTSAVIRCAHFYAINGKVMGRLRRFLEEMLERPAGHPDGGPMHYDGALHTFRMKHPDVGTAVLVPSMGSQRASRSDITPSLLDQWPRVSRAANLARRLRRKLMSRR